MIKIFRLEPTEDKILESSTSRTSNLQIYCTLCYPIPITSQSKKCNTLYLHIKMRPGLMFLSQKKILFFFSICFGRSVDFSLVLNIIRSHSSIVSLFSAGVSFPSVAPTTRILKITNSCVLLVVRAYKA